jgi:hypothetical protein
LQTELPLLELIGRLRFTFAKSYADWCPHEWTAARDAPADFKELAAAIRERGVVEYWQGRANRYLYPGDGWRYWHMGRVINRNTLAEAARLRDIGLIT